MPKINFIYEHNNYEIEAKENKTINYILNEYVTILNENLDDFLFLYKGKNIILFGENIINLSKNKNIMIMVFKKVKNYNKIEINDIICPVCQHLSFLNIKDDNNISIECPLYHKCKYSSFNTFIKSQIIDELKYKCEICLNKRNLYNDNNFYFCSCGISICQLCINKHSEDHNLIKYKKRYSNCNKHNKEFISYCSLCNYNLCRICEEDHYNHKSKIIIYKKEIKQKNKLNEIENKINENLDAIKEFQKHINILFLFFKYSINDINIYINHYISFYEKNLFILKELNNYQSIKNILNLKPDNLKNKLNNFFVEDVKNKMKYLIDYFINYKNEVTVIYKINKNENEIRLFGQKFIENNKCKCYIIINNKNKELIEFYKLSEKEKKIENIIIKVIFKDIITNMSYMFSNCSNLSSLPDISKLNTNNVTDMSYMFSDCSNLLSLPDISKWNTDNVTYMKNMFSDCSNLSSLPDISKWNTSNVTNLRSMYYNCSSLLSLPDISKWNVNNVTDMSYMFSHCSELSSLPDISKWNTNNVANISEMFSNCSKLSSLPDISKWNTNNVTDMSYMFSNCSNLSSLPDISKWNTNNVSNICHIFDYCSILSCLPDISKWNTNNITNLSYIFNKCLNLSYLPDISKWNVSKVIDISNIFAYCSKLSRLPDLSKWNTKNVMNMSYIFYNCYNLLSLPDISKWNTSKVFNMSNMFAYCYKLTSLPDISKWNINNVKDMSYMFSNCSNLLSLPDILIWTKSNVTNNSNMFSNCSKLSLLQNISTSKI